MHVLAGEQIWSGEECYVVRAIFSLESNLVAGDPEFRILCWPNSLFDKAAGAAEIQFGLVRVAPVLGRHAPRAEQGRCHGAVTSVLKIPVCLPRS